MQLLRPLPADVKPMEVQVVAMDWKWLFIFPEQGIATINELALPVDTEIARVRGVHGYQLPKWLANIRVDISNPVIASIAAVDGRPDVTLNAPLPTLRRIPSQSRISTNTSVGLVDGEWRQASCQTNPIEFAQTLFPRDVKLERAGGPISQLLDGLGAGKIVRLDVVKDAQMVLNMPRALQGALAL